MLGFLSVIALGSLYTLFLYISTIFGTFAEPQTGKGKRPRPAGEGILAKCNSKVASSPNIHP